MGDSGKIYVGNLPWSIDTDGLRDLFQDFGQIEDCVVIWDREMDRSKGFGFVTYSSQKEAEHAISNMAEYEVEGRNLNVKVANPRREGGGGGGYRGGDRGGRDRWWTSTKKQWCISAKSKWYCKDASSSTPCRFYDRKLQKKTSLLFIIQTLLPHAFASRVLFYVTWLPQLISM